LFIEKIVSFVKKSGGKFGGETKGQRGIGKKDINVLYCIIQGSTGTIRQ
jgi:hypothetical protein